jgi:hypothetical protein
MKKILLAISALFLVNAMFAQTQRVDARTQKVSAPFHKTEITGREQFAEPENVNPMTRNMSRNFIGTTYYDLQTNGSMTSRIVRHDDGTISAIWTTCGNGAATRGTGYNYYDGNSWKNASMNTDRIENVRTGWGTLACVGNAEIVVSHNGSNALVIAICPEKGTENWQFTTLQGPSVSGPNGATSTCLLWPAIATSGNTVHLIACTESDEGYLYQGIQTCLVYYRGTFNSSTNTIAWEQPRIVGNVTAAEVSKFSGDSYAIAAKGNNVAIATAPGMTRDAFIWKSTDNGVNFTKTVFFETPHAGDTAYRCDGSIAVAIGDDGLVHVAAGTYLCYIESDEATTYTWYPGVGYLLYWNENMSPITYDGTQSSADPDVVEQSGHGVIQRFNLDCDTSLWQLTDWGVDAYAEYGVGVVSFPQLVAQNGKVYMTFCQLMEYPFIDLDNSMYFRGVFATKSTDNGQSFGDISWLSYNRDCYYLSSWELFPMDEETTLNDILQYIQAEGENVFPAVYPNIVDGNIYMLWQTDPQAGTAIKDHELTYSADESYTYFFQMTADSIGIYNNVHEVCQGLWPDNYSGVGITSNDLMNMKMYPNPATETVKITFSAENAQNGVISVMNLMGQTVYTSNLQVNEGSNYVILPVNEFNAGVYMVTLRTNTGLSTQKLIVK